VDKHERHAIKEARRAAKLLHRENKERLLKKQELVKIRESRVKVIDGPAPTQSAPNTIDCACLIHSDGYDWTYVERLYNMLKRNLSKELRFHVFTEHDRSVPPYMIKHVLEEWPEVSGPKRSWWYKMQMFNPVHHAGPLLYFDLDVVIVDKLDWITELDPTFFWAPKDFRYLWKAHTQGINSSVMYWDTRQFDWVWNAFNSQDRTVIRRKYQGDQDFISDQVTGRRRRLLDEKRIISWRWQALDGGMITSSRTYREPNTGTRYNSNCSVLVFHGYPKPHECNDPIIKQFWT
jgi:hypothetical protein